MTMNSRNGSCGLRKLLRRGFTGMFTLWFALATVMGNFVYAQSANADFKAPIIEHETLGNGVWGNSEPFEATVVDDQELKSVSLFYRYAGELAFTELVMQPLVSSSSYTASVDTSLSEEPVSAIEYYIRAEDMAGNLVLKGFAFEPLVRELASPDLASTDTQNIAAPESINSGELQTKKGINWLYVALGALVLGGIAAGAGGGGSDSGGDPNVDCGTNCQVTLSIDTP